jgi:hypothetical protein
MYLTSKPSEPGNHSGDSAVIRCDDLPQMGRPEVGLEPIKARPLREAVLIDLEGEASTSLGAVC